MGESAPAMGVARRRKGKRRDWSDGAASTPSGGGWRRRERDHRAHRCRHLDGLGHPRLPRPAGRVDEEPGGREDVDDPALPRRPGRAPAGVAEPAGDRRRGRPSRTPATSPSSSCSDRDGCTPSSPRTSTACTRRRASPPSSVVEVHGTIWWTRCWDCQDRRPMAETLDRVRAGEDDPPCLVCGGILKSDTISFGQSLVPEVIDRALRRERGVRPAARRRVDAERLPGGQLRAAGEGDGCPRRDRQRRPDRDGPPRRRRPQRPDRRRLLPGDRRA